jgi:phosphoribosylamine--glycine ligase
MGSYSDTNHSLPFLTEEDVRAASEINHLIIEALSKEFNEPYIGILYGSFIATAKGISVIEFNARFGDPESLNVLTILESDFLSLCQSMVHGTLASYPIKFSHAATVCKYRVPKGYPDKPIKDKIINVANVKNKSHLYLGSVEAKENELIALGSRAAAYVGVGNTLSEAEALAEEEMQNIQGVLFHSEDIGKATLIHQREAEMLRLRSL